jgi:hypothetical protein
LERELSTRLKGELGAAGFDVLSLTLAAGAVAEDAIRVQDSGFNALAVFAIAHREGNTGSLADEGSGLQLWLSNPTQGATLISAGPGQHEDAQAATLLAVQGAELLRARLADWGQQQVAPAPIKEKLPSLPRQDRAQITAALALGVLVEGNSGAAALTPLLRIGYAPGRDPALGVGLQWGLRLSVAGLGTPSVLQGSLRHVNVRQSFALLEAVTALDSGGWLRPFASLGAGAYRVGVEGVGGDQAIGRSAETGSAVGAVGLGLSAHPLGALVGEVEAQGLFALRPTEVQIDRTEVARFGRPLFSLTIGIGVSL